MRIDNYNSPAINTTSIDKTTDAAAAEQKAARENSKRQDSVELSSLSQALSGSSAYPARLERLRQAVADGTYKVPAEELSRNIVDDAMKGS